MALEVEFLDVDQPDEPGRKIEVDYVSFVTSGTHGPPALVAPGRESGKPVAPLAMVGDKVLYINNSHDHVFTIERLSD
jgi:hypothetical protein